MGHPRRCIALLIWRTEYNYQYGAVNQLLGVVGIGPIPWLSDPIWNFVAMILTNVGSACRS